MVKRVDWEHPLSGRTRPSGAEQSRLVPRCVGRTPGQGGVAVLNRCFILEALARFARSSPNRVAARLAAEARTFVLVSRLGRSQPIESQETTKEIT